MVVPRVNKKKDFWSVGGSIKMQFTKFMGTQCVQMTTSEIVICTRCVSMVTEWSILPPCSRDPSPDARQYLKEWMKMKRSERQAEWRGQQEELRAQEHQPFMSPTQVVILKVILKNHG